MTVTTTVRTAGPFIGTGAINVYAFAFKVFLATDVLVQITSTLGVLSTAVLGTDYSVALNANQDTAPGGNVVLTAPLASGASLTIGSQVPLTQQVVLTNPGSFYSQIVSDALDKLTILVQQSLNSLTGALRIPEIGSAAQVLPAAAQRANQLLSFDASGNPVVVAPAAGTATALSLLLASSAGATNLGDLQAFTGAQARTQRAKNADTMCALEFAGVDPTGATDSTVGLSAAFASARVQAPGIAKRLLITSGTYKISGPIGAGSYVNVCFEPGVVIDATGLPNETTSVFNISGQSKVYFEGNGAVIKGARATANPAIEGNSAAFFVYGSTDVWIRDFYIQDFATDGITLSGNGAVNNPCVNVRIDGVTCTNNRRNGMSVIYANGVLVNGGLYASSNGAPNGPWAGIDFEPNTTQTVQGVKLNGVRTASNAGAGLLFVPVAQSLAAGTTFDVTVNGWRSDFDGLSGAVTVGKPSLLFASGGAWTNQVYGQIVVENAMIVTPKWAGVAQKNWDADKAPQVLCRNVRVLNADSTSNNPDNFGRTGFLVYADPTATVLTIGNMVFENCHAEDMRASPRMTTGMYVEASSTSTVKRVRFRNPRSVNFSGAAKVDVSMSAAITGTIQDVNVTYDSPILTTAIGGSQAIGVWLGKRITAAVAGATFTLPDVTKTIGARYGIYFASTATGCTVTAAATQTIKVPGSAAALSFAPAANDTWEIWNPDGSHWVATQTA